MPAKNPHDWQTNDDGEVNQFALDQGFHNGPRCTKCGFEFCQHCHPEGFETECGTPSLGADDSKIDPGVVALDAAIKSRLR